MSHPFWHESLMLLSCVTSYVGLWICYKDQGLAPQPQDLDEAEATSETLVRMTFVYWILYCSATFTQQFCGTAPEDIACSLHLLALLSYVLTFCCVLTLPLHLIEQRHR